MKLRTLETERFLLRALRESDVEAMLEIYGDPRVMQFHPWECFADLETARRAQRWMAGLFDAGRGVRWGVVSKEDPDGPILGSGGLDAYTPMSQCGEMGLELKREWWGKGVAPEVCRGIMDHCYGAMKVHRLEAWTVEENRSSRRVLERLGFSLEGVLRQKGYWKGAFRDLYLYSKLSGE